MYYIAVLLIFTDSQARILLYRLYNIMHCLRMMLAIDTKFSSIFGIKIGKKTPLNFIQTNSICETVVQIFC